MMQRTKETLTIEVHWSEIPGRDEAWKAETIKNTSEQQFNTEFNCVSGDTKVTLKNNDTGKVINVNISEITPHEVSIPQS
jgi:hypothetical protein